MPLGKIDNASLTAKSNTITKELKESDLNLYRKFSLRIETDEARQLTESIAVILKSPLRLSKFC